MSIQNDNNASNGSYAISEHLQRINKIANKQTSEELVIFVDLVKKELTDLLHYSKYNDEWDYIVIQMCVEKLNKFGNEGLTSISYSGVSEHYTDFYSGAIVKFIQSKRRLRMV